MGDKKFKIFKNDEEKMAYLFILLPVILLILFMIIPIVMAFAMSFTDYDVINKPNFVKLDNYKKMFSDKFFIISLKNTVVYTILYVPLGVLASLGTALFLNCNKKLSNLFRTLFYVPVLSSAVASSTIWYWMLNPQYGLINQVLAVFGIDGPAWLYSSKWAMVAIVVMSVWTCFGTNMIIFLTGLKGIPDAYYEAAALETNSKFKKFYYITLPSLSKTTFLVSTLLIIQAFQVFDQAYVLTEGGPGNSTITLVYYIYNNGFGSLKMGYASAISFFLFAIILIVSYFNNKANEVTE